MNELLLLLENTIRGGIFFCQESLFSWEGKSQASVRTVAAVQKGLTIMCTQIVTWSFVHLCCCHHHPCLLLAGLDCAPQV